MLFNIFKKKTVKTDKKIENKKPEIITNDLGSFVVYRSNGNVGVTYCRGTITLDNEKHFEVFIDLKNDEAWEKEIFDYLKTVLIHLNTIEENLKQAFVDEEADEEGYIDTWVSEVPKTIVRDNMKLMGLSINLNKEVEFSFEAGPLFGNHYITIETNKDLTYKSNRLEG